MKHQNSSSMTNAYSRIWPNENATNGSMQSSQLMKLFEDQLKGIYWTEKALTKAIIRMINNATSEELIDALKSHLAETQTHVSRLIQIFESLDKKATSKKCEAMGGLIKSAEEIMDSCEAGAMCDAGIISSAQKIEHYEIASYGTLLQFAETLGLTEAKVLLEATLNEESEADEKLSLIAQFINVEAADEEISE